MKRGVFRTLALMCAILLCAGAAHAAGTRYDLDALHMSLEFPADCDVVTRDTPADDPTYARYGFTKDTVDEMMEAGNAYLNALWSDGFKEVVVTMADNPLEDFGQLGDAMLSVIVSAIKEKAEENGITYTEAEIYQHAQVKFITLAYSKSYNDQLVYSLQYYTVCDKQAINIILNSYNGKVTQADRDKLREIVDSADFQNAKPVNDPDSSTEPFTYADAKTGTSFTVPVNWIQKDLSKEREIISAKFASTQEEGLTILYGSVDLWSRLPASEKQGSSRAELNSDVLTQADVADMAAEFGVKDASTSTADYGGKRYFLLEGEFDSQVAGMSIQMPVTMAMRLENGYLFQFQFVGQSDSPYFGDFTQLLESVRYSETSATPPTYQRPTVEEPSTFSTIPSTDTDTGSGAVVGILCAVAAAAVLAIVLIFKRGGAKGDEMLQKTPEDSWTQSELVARAENESPTEQGPGGDKAPQSEADTQDTADVGAEQDAPSQSEGGDQPKIRFCHKCGKELEPGSAVCSRCGAQIPDTRGGAME